MRLPECTESNSLLEGDLALASQQQTIKEMTVLETETGYSVAVTLKWEPSKIWYLTTRRNRRAPKKVTDLSRLNKQLKQIAPDQGYLLLRNQTIPKSN